MTNQIYSWCYYQGYSKTQRLLHYFDLHYAPEIGPLAPTYETQKWCKWCGFRMNIPAKAKYLCATSGRAALTESRKQ